MEEQNKSETKVTEEEVEEWIEALEQVTKEIQTMRQNFKKRKD